MSKEKVAVVSFLLFILVGATEAPAHAGDSLLDNFNRLARSQQAVTPSTSSKQTADGDLGSAMQSQAKIGDEIKEATTKKASSEALAQEALNIETGIFHSFYLQAVRAGIKFEPVSIPEKQVGAGVVTLNQTVGSFENGLFIVNRSCTLGCYTAPFVNITGLGLASLSINYDLPNIGVGSPDENGPSLADTCRFAGFNSSGYLSMPCATVFDRSQRTQVAEKIVAWLNKGLAGDMKIAEQIRAHEDAVKEDGGD